jgi:plasmid maintenance system antidote protein VapI
MQTLPSAADLRSLIARYQLQVYRLAALVGVHPSRLSLVLNERKPLPPLLARRLLKVIESEARAERMS